MNMVAGIQSLSVPRHPSETRTVPRKSKLSGFKISTAPNEHFTSNSSGATNQLDPMDRSNLLDSSSQIHNHPSHPHHEEQAKSELEDLSHLEQRKATSQF